MESKRRLLTKLRALRAKTVQNGATEAEAMAAAAKVAQLMAQYDVDNDSIDNGSIDDVIERAITAIADRDPLFSVLAAIMQFTSTVCFRSKRREEKTVSVDLFGNEARESVDVITYRFNGFPVDVEIAEYLAALCRAAMDRAAMDYLADTKTIAERRAAEKTLYDFQLGMARRMAKTINDLWWNRRKAPAVAAESERKTALVRQSLASRGIALRPSRNNRRRVDAAAYAAGESAGAGVRFNPAANGRGAMRAIAAQ